MTLFVKQESKDPNPDGKGPTVSESMTPKERPSPQWLGQQQQPSMHVSPLAKLQQQSATKSNE